MTRVWCGGMYRENLSINCQSKGLRSLLRGLLDFLRPFKPARIAGGRRSQRTLILVTIGVN